MQSLAWIRAAAPQGRLHSPSPVIDLHGLPQHTRRIVGSHTASGPDVYVQDGHEGESGNGGRIGREWDGGWGGGEARVGMLVVGSNSGYH